MAAFGMVTLDAGALSYREQTPASGAIKSPQMARETGA
jgi:hypothetical protein